MTRASPLAGLERARRLGLETTVYTVNDARRMRALSAMGVGGIFSDDTALLRETLDSWEAGADRILTDCPDRAREALRPR